MLPNRLLPVKAHLLVLVVCSTIDNNPTVQSSTVIAECSEAQNRNTQSFSDHTLVVVH